MATKLYYNGKRINGRFASFKSTVKRIVRFFFRWSVISAMAYALFWAGATFYPSISYATKEVEVNVLPQKIADLKLDLVNRLSDCERAGHSEDDGLVTYDNNKAGTLTGKNIPSFGVLQFKSSTVQRFVKARDGKDISTKDAILLALDADEAKSLATYAIFEKGAVNEWYNCSLKLGLASEVKLINRLSN